MTHLSWLPEHIRSDEELRDVIVARVVAAGLEDDMFSVQVSIGTLGYEVEVRLPLESDHEEQIRSELAPLTVSVARLTTGTEVVRRPEDDHFDCASAKCSFCEAIECSWVYETLKTPPSASFAIARWQPVCHVCYELIEVKAFGELVEFATPNFGRPFAVQFVRLLSERYMGPARAC